jgi:hypothetical protein
MIERTVVRSLAITVVAVVVTIAIPMYVFLVLNDGMLHGQTGGDEGYFVWCGWCITKGLAPYRDFIEFKPPLQFLTHALALKLHGFANLGYRHFFSYFPLTSIVLLQLSLISRRVDKLFAMALSIALIHIWLGKFHDTGLSDSESVGLAYYFLAVAFLLVRTPFPRVTNVIGGAFLVCCALSKEPFLPCVVCTWATCFIASERKLSLRDDFIAYAKYTVLGGAIVVVALCIYMAPTGSLKAYIAMVGRYTVVYRDPMQSFCVQGGVFQPTTPLNDFLRQWHRARVGYINLSNLGYLIPFGVASIVFVWRRSVPLFVAMIACCVTAFLAVTASNCPWPHYFNMMLSGLFFALAIGLDSMTPYLSAADRSTRIFMRLAVLGAVLLSVWPRFEAELPAYGTRVFPVGGPGEEVPGSFEAVRKYTVPKDRVLTTGNPIFYVQMDRLSAIRESNLLDPILPYYVGATDEEKLRPLREELVMNRPKVVIMSPQFAYAKVRHNKALFMPFLTEFQYKELSPGIYVRPD